MAFTYPTTRVANEIIDATDWNTDVTDDIKWLGKDKPSCRVYNNATIAHTSTGNWQAVTHNSERWDIGGLHSTVTNTSRITIPTGGGGIYLIGGSIQWATNGTGIRAARCLLNGATTILYDSIIGSASGVGITTYEGLYVLAAGDYIELSGFQSSGGNLNMALGSNYALEFWCMWMNQTP